MKRTAVTANTRALREEMLRNSGDTNSTSPAFRQKLAGLDDLSHIAYAHGRSSVRVAENLDQIVSKTRRWATARGSRHPHSE
jgi:hypothetical protein